MEICKNLLIPNEIDNLVELREFEENLKEIDLSDKKKKIAKTCTCGNKTDMRPNTGAIKKNTSVIHASTGGVETQPENVAELRVIPSSQYIP